MAQHVRQTWDRLGAVGPLVAVFLLAWLVFAAIYVVLPFEPLFDDTSANRLVALYVVLTVAAATFLAWRWPRRSQTVDRLAEVAERLSLPQLLIGLQVVVALGLALHLYAKIFQLGIDYGLGLGVARNHWIERGLQYEGVVSWQSAAGHLLSHFVFPAFFVLILYWEKLPGPMRFLSLGFCLASLFVYAGAIGSRSVPFFAIAFLVGIFCLRATQRLPLLPGPGVWRFPLWLLVLGLFLFYSSFVFQERVRSHVPTGSAPGTFISDEEMPDEIDTYIGRLYRQLGGRPTETFARLNELPDGQRTMVHYVTMSGLYIGHAQWTFAKVLNIEDRQGSNLFNAVRGSLVEVGFWDRDELSVRSFGGVMLNLPGCVWYDFGIAGLILAALFHGFMMYWSSRRVSEGEVPSVFWQIGFVCVATGTALAPLNSMANLMSFPFMGIAMFSLWLVFAVALRRPAVGEHVKAA